MHNVDVRAASKYFKADSSVKVNLLGMITVGEHKNSYTIKETRMDIAAQTVTVTFGPPQVSGTIPLENQVAQVVGGAISNV